MTRPTPQPGILADLTPVSRYLFFRLRTDADAGGLRAALPELVGLGDVVIGLGRGLVERLGGGVPALRDLPALTGPTVSVPATPMALWCWLRGDDPGALLHLGRDIAARLEPLGLSLERVVNGFKYDIGRDLSGYEDGTENPTGDEAVAAALDGGASYVAVQVWQHDLDRFQSYPPEERDHMIGRRIADNEEIDDAPASAHVKRTAQEDFEPEAFVVRRSVPWSDGGREGLVFVAFGHSLDAFESLLRHMVGLDDGITDALFRFTRPLTSSSFWCPPLAGGRLDLSSLG